MVAVGAPVTVASVDAGAQYLVFDVGGTQLRAATWNADSAWLSSPRVVEAPSYIRHPGLSWLDLRGRLVAEMSALRMALDPAGHAGSVAVAFPGPVDQQERVLAAPTLWGDGGPYPYALGDDLRDAWPGTSVRILNDVAAAGYRYMRDEADAFCVVTVSTGIGNKVFVGGRPLVGPQARGGEIGHVVVDPSPNAPACDCGGQGHLGAFASGRGLVQRAREEAERSPEAFRRSILVRDLGLEPSGLTAEALARAYGVEDDWATQRINQGANALGGVLATIHLAIGVERFVLIGGFALGLGRRFADTVCAVIDARCWRGGTRTVSVALGEGDGRCVLIGAGRAASLGMPPRAGPSFDAQPNAGKGEATPRV
jgi:predicted NBD/HSP70 family sugar kinase